MTQESPREEWKRLFHSMRWMCRRLNKVERWQARTNLVQVLAARFQALRREEIETRLHSLRRALNLAWHHADQMLGAIEDAPLCWEGPGERAHNDRLNDLEQRAKDLQHEIKAWLGELPMQE